MPAPRKFSDEQRKEILDAFHSDIPAVAVGEMFGVDYSRTIRKLWASEYGEEPIRLRFKRLCALSKHGKSNPMFGKYKEKHHLYRPVHYHAHGYKIVEAPRWYLGPTDKNGKALEHIVIACLQARIRQLPEFHVVHHKDEDKLNNHPDNLEILSRASHMLKHRWLRHKKKVQRLSRKGVGSKKNRSALQPKADDIV